MKITNLLDNLVFRDSSANSEPLYVDANGRALRFTLKPGQSIKEHKVPSSPFYVVVIKGNGMFSGGDGEEVEVGPNSLLIFSPAENHTVRALDEELVFVGLLHGVASTPPDKVGGTLGRE